MIKRIIAILLVFSMLPFCVYAEDLTDEKDYNIYYCCHPDDNGVSACEPYIVWRTERSLFQQSIRYDVPCG